MHFGLLYSEKRHTVIALHLAIKALLCYRQHSLAFERNKFFISRTIATYCSTGSLAQRQPSRS